MSFDKHSFLILSLGPVGGLVDGNQSSCPHFWRKKPIPALIFSVPVLIFRDFGVSSAPFSLRENGASDTPKSRKKAQELRKKCRNWLLRQKVGRNSLIPIQTECKQSIINIFINMRCQYVINTDRNEIYKRWWTVSRNMHNSRVCNKHLTCHQLTCALLSNFAPKRLQVVDWNFPEPA